MKLSIVIPAHNEAGSIGSTLADIAERLDAEGVDYEIVAVDDASSDGTGAVIRAAGETNARIRYHRSHNPPGFGFAVRAGLDVYEGDAAAIVMADGSDSPEDIATYYRVLSEGYDCAFGSRFVRGSRVIDYPKPKLALNRLVNVFIRMLFRHGYNDTTNAFKAYRREAIDTCRPLFSNHFNLTVELPLKAVVRGHSYKIVPDLVDEPQGGRVQAQAPGDGEPVSLRRSLHVPGTTSGEGGLPPCRAGIVRDPERRARAARGRASNHLTGRDHPRERHGDVARVPVQPVAMRLEGDRTHG